jgi:hypothetical protein
MNENRLTGKKHPREEQEQEQEGKDARETEINDAISKSCLVCLDTQDMTTNLISSHQCQQCKPNSWSICTKCEDSLFSKLCPICRTDYAPLKYYHFSPSPPPPPSPSETRETQRGGQKEIFYQNALNLTKISLIQYEKIGVWCPQATPPVIHFSLPQDLTVSPKEMKFLHVTLPITDPNELQRLRDNSTNTEPMFLFTNSVWDRLDAILEGGTELSSSREVSISQQEGGTSQSQQQAEDNLTSSSPPQLDSVPTVPTDPAALASATAAPAAAPVTVADEDLEEEGGVGAGEEEEEVDDEDCPQLLGIKETLQRIIALLATEGSVFLTPLNSVEASELIEAYVASS